MELRAYAKINLTLEVQYKRDDGYHEVSTILQTISLHDVIRLEPAPDIQMFCDAPALAGEGNLAYRAALLLRETTGYTGGAAVHLEKGIPISAGLGGGSSDAATVLSGLNQLWGIGLAIDKLGQLAAQLGSDVPFFLRGGTALGTGRGEKVNQLPSVPRADLVVCVPKVDIPNKTAFMYGLLSSEDFSDGSHTMGVAFQISSGHRIESDHLFNVFQMHAVTRFPETVEAGQALNDLGLDAVLTGAGPSLYALLPQDVDRQEVKDALAKQDLEFYIVNTVSSHDVEVFG